MSGMVDAAPVREHVLDLYDHGFSLNEVARSSGVSKNGIMDLVSGKTRRMRAGTASAVMAVGYRDRSPMPGQYVDKTRFVEIVDRLLDHGLSQMDISRMTGVCRDTICHRYIMKYVSHETERRLLDNLPALVEEVKRRNGRN